MKPARTTSSTAAEDSILFNLRELMHLESERAHGESLRLAEEAEKKRHEAEAAERRRIDEALALAQKAEAEHAALLQQAARDKARARDEQIAMELRVRLEIEQKARAAEFEQRLQHARAIAESGHPTGAKSSKFAIAATLVAVLATVGVVAYAAQNSSVPAARSVAPAAPTAMPVVATPAAPIVAAAPAAEAPASERRTPRTRSARSRVRADRPIATPTGLESLGDDGPADVLVGIEEARTPRRRR